MLKPKTKKLAYENWLRSARDGLEEWISDKDDDNIRLLYELREHILKQRGEDITAELYFYDSRVYLSEISRDIHLHSEDNLSCPPISWETIRRFPFVGPDGREIYYELDKRTVKLCFLRAWLEVEQWKRRGAASEPEPFPFILPKTLQEAGLEADVEDQFLLGESASFSHIMMLKYYDLWLSLKPKERTKRPRFIDEKQIKHSRKSLAVFVPPDLWEYYYGKEVDNEDGAGKDRNEKFSGRLTNVACQSFPPAIGGWKTIWCNRINETRHAVIANFISWQHWLHSVRAKKGNSMGLNHQDANNSRPQEKKSKRDKNNNSFEIQYILDKIEVHGVNSLSDEESSKLKEKFTTTPNVKNFRAVAHRKHVRMVIGEALKFQDKLVSGQTWWRKIAYGVSRIGIPRADNDVLFFRKPFILSTAAALLAAFLLTPMLWDRKAPSFDQLVLTGISPHGQIFQIGPSVRTRGASSDEFTLKSGDQAFISFKTKNDGSITVIRMDESNGTKVLFSERVSAGKLIQFPLGLLPTGPTGKTTILAIATAKPIQEDELVNGLHRIQQQGTAGAHSAFPDANIEILSFRHE